MELELELQLIAVDYEVHLTPMENRIVVAINCCGTGSVVAIDCCVI